MVGADAVGLLDFFLSNKALTALAIPTLILCGVNMRSELFPDELAAALVTLVGSTDEVGRMDTELTDKILKFLGILGDVGLYGLARLGGFPVYLIPVLVGAGLEADNITEELMVTEIDVRKEIIHGVADVRITVDIGDSCGDVLFCHENIIQLNATRDKRRWTTKK